MKLIQKFNRETLKNPTLAEKGCCKDWLMSSIRKVDPTIHLLNAQTSVQNGSFSNLIRSLRVLSSAQAIIQNLNALTSSCKPLCNTNLALHCVFPHITYHVILRAFARKHVSFRNKRIGHDKAYPFEILLCKTFKFCVGAHSALLWVKDFLIFSRSLFSHVSK